MKKLTQKQRILLDLQENANNWLPVTVWWDARPRIIRVASRIHELREEGHNIETRTKLGYAEYKLLEEGQLSLDI